MNAQILDILKYAGFALAAAAAVWGMVRKTTFEDPQGQKRLTPAGYVAIAFVLGSGLVSAGAFGVDNVIKSQEKHDREQATARSQAEAANKDERDAQRILLSQALTRAAAAESRARDAKQESLTLALGTQARARDLALAQNVSRGAAANLAKAERTLAEIGRVLQPMGVPHVRVTWRIQGPVELSESLKERIRWLAAEQTQLDKPPGYDWSRIAGTTGSWRDSRIASVSGIRDTLIFPNYRLDPVLANTVEQMNGRLVFFSPVLARDALRYLSERQNRDALDELYRKGDFSFAIPGRATAVEYETDWSGMSIVNEGSPNPDEIVRHGALAAVQDFEKSTLIFYMAGMSGSTGQERDLGLALRARMVIDQMSIQLAGRLYLFSARDFRRIELPEGKVAFVLDRVGEPWR